MTILLTGSSGMIGTRLAEKLLEVGFDPKITINEGIQKSLQ